MDTLIRRTETMIEQEQENIRQQELEAERKKEQELQRKKDIEAKLAERRKLVLDPSSNKQDENDDGQGEE